MGNSAPVQLGDGPLPQGCIIEKDVLFRMKDGVHITCDMYRPEKPGKYPALFASSPYIKDSINLPSTSMYRYCELLSHRA